MNKKIIFETLAASDAETSALKLNKPTHLKEQTKMYPFNNRQQEIVTNINMVKKKFESNETLLDGTVVDGGYNETVQRWRGNNQKSPTPAKPVVPPKPIKKKSGTSFSDSSCQDIIHRKEHETPTTEEKCHATVNKIRQQFEEKCSLKNGLNTSVNVEQRPASPKFYKPNETSAKSVTTQKEIKVQPNHPQIETDTYQNTFKIIQKFSYTSVDTANFKSQTLPRSKKNSKLFNSNANNDFEYNSGNQRVQVELESSTVEELKEDNAFPKHETDIQIADTPKGLGRSSRQRSSYAEPRTRTELMPTMSFSCVDLHSIFRKKKPHEVKKEQLTDIEFLKKIQHITDELIKTEKDYVNNLFFVIMKYGSMFTRKDLPRGLVGKWFDLFGNIKRIAAFHRDTLLPMFERNKNDIQKLCEEFADLIDNGDMYDYVLYTINKRRSLAVCADFVPYFEYIKLILEDQLGIESFLLQPIQRLPRYQMLINKYISEEFLGCVKRSGTYNCIRMKKECDLEKKIENLLKLADEAEHISNIIDWHKLNICDSNNKFRKTLEFFIYDRGQLRGFSGRVFIFQKFLIYTEVMGNDLIYRGCYDAVEGFGLFAEENSFTMANRNQLCDFRANAAYIKSNLRYIEDLIYLRPNARLTSGEVTKIDRERFPAVNGNTSRCDSGLGNMFTLDEENES